MKNSLLPFLYKLIDDIENNRMGENQMVRLGEAIRYYYYNENESDIKYFTLGYYIYNFLLKY